MLEIIAFLRRTKVKFTFIQKHSEISDATFEILEATFWHSSLFVYFTSTIGTGLQHRFEAYED